MRCGRQWTRARTGRRDAGAPRVRTAAEVENCGGFGFNWGMKGRRGVVAAVSALLVVALVFLWCGSRREPRFHGKSLSAWLAEGVRRPVAAWGVEVSVINTKQEAVRAMGTNALPFLVKWMQYESPPWRVRLTSIAPRVPKRLWFLFKDKRADRAALSLTCL